MATFYHTIGARENEHYRIEISDVETRNRLQERYAIGDEIQARAMDAKERARGKAMMRRAASTARKVAS